MKSPILGSSYVARSVNAADNRMVNLFPEIVAEGGKEAAFLNRAPGLALLATVGNGPIRGMWVFGVYLYVVSGGSLYRVDVNYNITQIVGSIPLIDSTIVGTGPVSMSDNGTQLMISANGEGYIYWPSSTNGVTFSRIIDPNFPGSGSVCYFDGWFVTNQPGTQTIWVSSLLDGSIWDATTFAAAEGSPDNVVGIIVDHRELWIFGTNTTEIWYDAGNAGFPFAPIQGAFSEIGCASAATICKMDNAIFWLSGDARGHGVVYRSSGYNGIRISTHAVEWQIQQYGDLSTALAYTYQQDGHAFYVLVFPNQNTTWVYDVSTQAWHERCGFVNGQLTRHQGNCQAFFNNKTTIGDYSNGNIYAFDLNTYADNGSTQKWLRSWRALPPEQNDLNRSAHHSLQLDCESGVGLNSGQGIIPQVMLRWSDDGGHTWSNEHWVTIGKIGSYGHRAIWRRLGMTTKLRDRVYEVSGTDPVKTIIMGAELSVSQTNA